MYLRMSKISWKTNQKLGHNEVVGTAWPNGCKSIYLKNRSYGIGHKYRIKNCTQEKKIQHNLFHFINVAKASTI